jgi:hypothetical protein
VGYVRSSTALNTSPSSSTFAGPAVTTSLEADTSAGLVAAMGAIVARVGSGMGSGVGSGSKRFTFTDYEFGTGSDRKFSRADCDFLALGTLVSICCAERDRLIVVETIDMRYIALF